METDSSIPANLARSHMTTRRADEMLRVVKGRSYLEPLTGRSHEHSIYQHSCERPKQWRIFGDIEFLRSSIGITMAGDKNILDTEHFERLPRTKPAGRSKYMKSKLAIMTEIFNEEQTSTQLKMSPSSTVPAARIRQDSITAPVKSSTSLQRSANAPAMTEAQVYRLMKSAELKRDQRNMEKVQFCRNNRLSNLEKMKRLFDEQAHRDSIMLCTTKNMIVKSKKAAIAREIKRRQRWISMIRRLTIVVADVTETSTPVQDYLQGSSTPKLGLLGSKVSPRSVVAKESSDDQSPYSISNSSFSNPSFSNASFSSSLPLKMRGNVSRQRGHHHRTL